MESARMEVLAMLKSNRKSVNFTNTLKEEIFLSDLLRFKKRFPFLVYVFVRG